MDRDIQNPSPPVVCGAVEFAVISKNCVEQEIQIDRRRNAITHLRELASSLQTKLPDIDPTRAESPFAVSKVKIPQANKPVVKTHRPDLR